jgi:adenine-specific DNA-methyltransferase
VRWASLRRFEDSSRRNGPQPRPDQFYPIYVGIASNRIEDVGTSLAPNVDRSTVRDRPGFHTVWPLKPDGTEMIWGLTPATLRKRLAEGFVKVIPGRGGKAPTLYYLTSGQVADVASGDLRVTGHDADGSVVVEFETGKATLPTTQWDNESHNAQTNGTGLLVGLIPRRKFPFSKSLHAVEDTLRLVVGGKGDAVIVDFFAGSGTTLHAVMRLNKQDNGRGAPSSSPTTRSAPTSRRRSATRACAPVTRSGKSSASATSSPSPASRLPSPARRPTASPSRATTSSPTSSPWPTASRRTPSSSPSPTRRRSASPPTASSPRSPRSSGCAPAREAAASTTSRGWDVADTYGVLADLDKASDFFDATTRVEGVEVVYIVTDEDRLFESLAQQLPDCIEPVRLYESYLRNFEIESSRGAL